MRALLPNYLMNYYDFLIFIQFPNKFVQTFLRKRVAYASLQSLPFLLFHVPVLLQLIHAIADFLSEARYFTPATAQSIQKKTT